MSEMGLPKIFVRWISWPKAWSLTMILIQPLFGRSKKVSLFMQLSMPVTAELSLILSMSTIGKSKFHPFAIVIKLARFDTSPIFSCSFSCYPALRSFTFIGWKCIFLLCNRNKWEDNSPLSGNARKHPDGGLAISLSACLDNQVAADTTVSYALVQ